jgi:RimJ/RimL family protein N-acetyltransferase
MKAPEHIETARLVLRKPRATDAGAIFARYASDAEVTRLLGWPRHRTLAETQAFLEFCAAEWSQWPAGPYLVESRENGMLLGSTGLAFETPQRAATGYVFAKDAWGHGYATEALRAVTTLGPSLELRRIYALCHAGHTASARVLEKGGFTLEGILRKHTVFPNLGDATPNDVACYAWIVT